MQLQPRAERLRRPLLFLPLFDSPAQSHVRSFDFQDVVSFSSDILSFNSNALNFNMWYGLGMLWHEPCVLCQRKTFMAREKYHSDWLPGKSSCLVGNSMTSGL
jgi:hypothetical protein